MCSGKQLVHTEYLQYLTALAVGLGLDTPLTNPPTPPHLPILTTPPEWAWLKKFTSAIHMSESFKYRKSLPSDLNTVIPDIGDETGKYKPEVCTCVCIYTL